MITFCNLLRLVWIWISQAVYQIEAVRNRYEILSGWYNKLTLRPDVLLMLNTQQDILIV